MDLTVYLWTHGYKVGRVHTSVTFAKSNDGNTEKSTRSDTMGGITNNSGWVSGEWGLGESNSNNFIYISHYINTVFHSQTIDSTIKYGLTYTGESGT